MSSWKCIRSQHKIRHFLRVSGLDSIEAREFHRLDSNIRRNNDTGLYHVLNTDARSHRIDTNIRTRARTSLTGAENCRRDLFLQIREGLCAFTLLAPPGLQPGLRLGVCSVNIACRVSGIVCPLSRKRARSSLSATASTPRSADADSPGVSSGISTSCCSRGAGSPSLSLATPVPGPHQPQVPHLVCVCQSANVRDLQDHAPLARQSVSDILRCEV